MDSTIKPHLQAKPAMALSGHNTRDCTMSLNMHIHHQVHNCCYYWHLTLALGWVDLHSYGVAAIVVLSWIYNYVSGNQPAGFDTLDYAKGYLTDMARDVKERAKDYGSYAHGKIQEATQEAY
ncbi:hypothetical protein LR48_Vigan10g201200 [Vigna angularis]|uniref:Oleosin 1 n=1 Tax=Phaseolus angularis TaxID=3914 RepID=A0A0L9VM44_PHAAN|nr:Oleosin 1 [Vigna angularis]KOM56120.1 hypothetical protein LR48_Vigan10g201200 [Vigna angularis]